MDTYAWDEIHAAMFSMGSNTSRGSNTTSASVLAPPNSDGASDSPVPAQIAVSSTFGPDAAWQRSANQGPGHVASPPDIALLTSDRVNFYIHSSTIDTSSHRLSGRVPSVRGKAPPIVIDVPETAAVLNVILHALHGLSCAQYSPSLDVLVEAVECMLSYGMDPKSTVVPSTSLFSLLLSQAPLYPLRVFTLAAHYDIIDLAVPTSSHLLSFQLSALTDADVQRMGPVYLRRLMFMHNGRVDALRRVLVSPPYPHPPTAACDFANQKSLNRAWALATAYLAWDIRPDVSTGAIEAALRPLAARLPCKLCRQALDERIKSVVTQWSVVKRTI
ncbi:unnamed protein product [Mycena citricolor]|uniref:BTB domain-containing protein n=1 Tax=Mycena citricolor TaxID=2018698 RepID=A0AAD2HTQ9_9AGAR|nr:unnamed protein product [Mycena citricolor]